MGTTAHSIEYPDPTGVPARGDLQTIATTTETALEAIDTTAAADLAAAEAFTKGWIKGLYAVQVTVSMAGITAGTTVVPIADVATLPGGDGTGWLLFACNSGTEADKFNVSAFFDDVATGTINVAVKNISGGTLGGTAAAHPVILAIQTGGAAASGS